MGIKALRFWTWLLSVMFLVATFVHNFTTLGKYHSDLVIHGIDVVTWSNVMLVAGIDMAIFFSITYIVSNRGRTMASLAPAKWILFLAGVVSAILNVYYMMEYAPAGRFAQAIGITVGILIPVMIVLLGWIEGGRPREAPAVQAKKKKKIKNKRIRNHISTVSSTPKTQPKDKPDAVQSPIAPAEPGDPVVAASYRTSPLELRIKEELEKNPLKSNRDIARRLNCSHTTVSKVRAKYGIY